jgi:hypothetical protein
LFFLGRYTLNILYKIMKNSPISIVKGLTGNIYCLLRKMNIKTHMNWKHGGPGGQGGYGGQWGEMAQTMYAHMNKGIKK